MGVREEKSIRQLRKLSFNCSLFQSNSLSKLVATLVARCPLPQVQPGLQLLVMLQKEFPKVEVRAGRFFFSISLPIFIVTCWANMIVPCTQLLKPGEQPGL